MRFYEGDHAYEVERILDPATQLYSGWRYNLYRVRPGHELLRSGEALIRIRVPRLSMPPKLRTCNRDVCFKRHTITRLAMAVVLAEEGGIE